jgi:hypothetical protein
LAERKEKREEEGWRKEKREEVGWLVSEEK